MTSVYELVVFYKDGRSDNFGRFDFFADAIEFAQKIEQEGEVAHWSIGVVKILRYTNMGF